MGKSPVGTIPPSPGEFRGRSTCRKTRPFFHRGFIVSDAAERLTFLPTNFPKNQFRDWQTKRDGLGDISVKMAGRPGWPKATRGGRRA